MTDNEIIKALECCVTYEFCTGCPLVDNCPSCYSLLKSALDLINRQKAELDRCHKELDEFKFLASRVNSIKNTSQDTFSGILISMAEGVARYEAIEEFAERLKDENNLSLHDDGYDIWVDYDKLIKRIDNLVKEMVGEG